MSVVITLLRVLYGVTLLGVVASTGAPAIRSFSKNVRPKDFDYMLFCGLAVNRLFFLWWAARGDPDSAYGQDELVIFCYIIAIALEWGVMLSRRWETRRVS